MEDNKCISLMTFIHEKEGPMSTSMGLDKGLPVCVPTSQGLLIGIRVWIREIFGFDYNCDWTFVSSLRCPCIIGMP